MHLTIINSTEASKEDVFLQKYKVESDSLIKAGKNEYEVEDYIFWNHKAEAEFLRPPFSLLMAHIEYVIKLVGVDYVGIGTDYDGVVSVPQEMDDVTKYPLITKALVERGYKKICDQQLFQKSSLLAYCLRPLLQNHKPPIQLYSKI